MLRLSGALKWSVLASTLVAGVLLAQDSRGKILGMVTDPSGSVIPNATVTALQLERNTSTPTRTNAAGNYEIPFLLPGRYRLEVTLLGFKRYTREPIEVRVGETETVDVQLELGATSESVRVTAVTPLLDESSATVGQTVDRHQLENLPIGGDDAMYLVQLGAGVTTTAAPGHNWLPSAVGTISTFTAGGTRSGSNEFTLDGIPNMTGTSVSFVPPADIIQEFRVDVTNYDASVGHGMGAHVNMMIKAGTNELHGTALWQVAPAPLQANDFFGNKALYDLSTGPVTPQKRAQYAPPRKVNRYSTTATGPVFIPHLYDGRNKVFWTYGFQGFNRRNPSATYLTVPTLAERKGDFSGLLALGSQYQIYDPATIQPATSGRFSRQPLSGNIIPASRLDPMAQKVLQYWALPNSTGATNGENNYQNAVGDSNDFLQHMARVDDIVNDRHRMFARYTHSWLHYYTGNNFNNGVTGYDRVRHQNGVSLDDVWVVSPSFLVDLKYGFTIFQETDYPYTKGFDLAGLGFPQSFVSQLDPQAIAFPQISVDTFSGLGSATDTNSTTNYHTWGGSVTQIFGSHSLKWGGEFRLMREQNYSFGNGAPLLNFSTNWTRGPLDNSAASPIGQGLASFLFGLPTGGNVDVNASSATQSTFTGLYIQDDWKVTRKLTLNMGMRWEHESAPTERFNRTVLGFDFNTPNPVQAAAQANYAKSPIPEIPAAAFTTPGGLTFAGVNGNSRNIFDTSMRDFAPRFGFAWQAMPKTVVRGGYGIFYDLLGVDHTGVTQTGFSQRTTLVPTQNSGQTFIATLSNPFPNIQRPGAVGPTTYIGQGVSFQPAFRPTPYLQNWSLSVQRQLPSQMVLDVSYMGNRLTRMAVDHQYDAIPRQYLSTSPVRDANAINFLTAAVPNPFAGIPAFSASGLTGQTVARSQLLLPYPEFTGITAPWPVGFSWYHSLQVRLNKRLTKGATFNVSYTFSKMMEAASFLNATDTTPEHVIGGQDRPHRLVLTWVYELPIGRGRSFGAGMNRMLDAAIGGWQLNGIYQAQSGAPLAFGNVLYIGDLHDIVLPTDQRKIEMWFNTSAGFDKKTAEQLANNIRAFPSRLAGLRGPGINYWILSMNKNFRFHERFRWLLSTNWEGAMNHPLFSTPNMTPTSALFGTVTGTTGEARRIYVGLKLSF